VSVVENPFVQSANRPAPVPELQVLQVKMAHIGKHGPQFLLGPLRCLGIGEYVGEIVIQLHPIPFAKSILLVKISTKCGCPRSMWDARDVTFNCSPSSRRRSLRALCSLK